ncbi:hypothetical protein BC938DRAFT_479006 [Jimgerdemannia flammicorona]|uniref:Uncharacterized protein n=1 Tax=Jimgerdemannia flammicorona TaxID=994334 RepID=A0A433QLT2_9FUNG|nr:hypothetical protein BC938DRAFT_479006 [Jimgerdemannia flammicorona]
MEPVLKVKIQPLEYIYPPASLLSQFPCLLPLSLRLVNKPHKMGPRDAKDKAPRSVINRFFKNSIKRITESRWTLIFMVAAIVQFVAIFIIQMFIMFYNIEEMSTLRRDNLLLLLILLLPSFLLPRIGIIITDRLTELDDKRTVIYPNSMDDPLTVAYDRYVRLVFENIFFIVFIFMMGIFGIDGVGIIDVNGGAGQWEECGRLRSGTYTASSFSRPGHPPEHGAADCVLRHQRGEPRVRGDADRGIRDVEEEPGRFGWQMEYHTRPHARRSSTQLRHWHRRRTHRLYHPVRLPWVEAISAVRMEHLQKDWRGPDRARCACCDGIEHVTNQPY